MSKLTEYAANQRSIYDRISGTLAHAKAAVAPNYDDLDSLSEMHSRVILNEYFFRRGGLDHKGTTKGLNALDFGCGVGRMMVAMKALGVSVDGADISAQMLGHAKADRRLSGSKFFLSSGSDSGDVPSDHYGIAYSMLCLHHIPMRLTRINILAALHRALKDTGMIFLEFKLFPGANAARIPHNHAHWSENVVAKGTNSLADVWITPDGLGLVYDDLRLFFSDIMIREVDIPDAQFNEYSPEHIYQYPFNPVYVIASKRPMLHSFMLEAC